MFLFLPKNIYKLLCINLIFILGCMPAKKYVEEKSMIFTGRIAEKDITTINMIWYNNFYLVHKYLQDAKLLYQFHVFLRNIHTFVQ